MKDDFASQLEEAKRLVGAGEYRDALALIEQLWPKSPDPRREVRLINPKAQAMARLGDHVGAREILQSYHERGLLDPDTKGVLARTWMDTYDHSGRHEDLAKSRDLYAEAFSESEAVEEDPKTVSIYTGLNAAAKSRLLKEEDEVARWIPRVANLVDESSKSYWDVATRAELQLLSGNYAEAADLYQQAVNLSPHRYGDHGSTWLQARRLMRAQNANRRQQTLVWRAFSHLGDAAPTPTVSQPPFRRLRAYAFDPSLARDPDTAGMNAVTLPVRWETRPGDSTSSLRPGPIGEYLEVIDYDPASGCFYEPIDLDDHRLLATDGLAPGEGDPKFHQQMVYAVAMNVIGQFEHALGRPAQWSTRGAEDSESPQFVRRLRIYPHALREANAYYSPEKKAILFGYFPGDGDNSKVLPGGIVFTCLSHDIIAHEVSHALLDGMRPHFAEPSNRDVLAFHEAFADIVALFEHFSHPEVLKQEIAATRGDLTSGTLLGQLAQEFGVAIGQRGALRDAIGTFDKETDQWQLREPDPMMYRTLSEPHERGSVLVGALFSAFLTIYRRRTADLLRIATQGSGILRAGAIHPDLTNRLAAEAAKAASHLLRMAVRALDYCPPVDITFGDYLRALLTADLDLVANDRFHYRLAIIDSFQQHGIYPADARNLSIENLVWRPPRGHLDLKTLGMDLRQLVDDLSKTLDRPLGHGYGRETLWEWTRESAAGLEEFLRERCSPALADELGLDLSVDAPGSIHRNEKGMPAVKVESVQVARRTLQNGQLKTDVIVEILQRRRGYLDEETQDLADLSGNLPGQRDDGDFTCRGGCTMVIDPLEGAVRYVVTKHILSNRRLRRQRRFLTGKASLRNTYFGDPGLSGGAKNEPFAILHRGD